MNFPFWKVEKTVFWTSMLFALIPAQIFFGIFWLVFMNHSDNQNITNMIVGVVLAALVFVFFLAYINGHWMQYYISKYSKLFLHYPDELVYSDDNAIEPVVWDTNPSEVRFRDLPENANLKIFRLESTIDVEIQVFTFLKIKALVEYNLYGADLINLLSNFGDDKGSDEAVKKIAKETLIKTWTDALKEENGKLFLKKETVEGGEGIFSENFEKMFTDAVMAKFIDSPIRIDAVMINFGE
jgi:hypothetical protein